MTSTLRRRTPALAALLAATAGLAALDRSPVGVYYDDAHYVLLGRALATGEGYRYLNLPGAPFATHYPPGYPALLALLWRFAPQFPANVVVFKLANVALLIVTALGTLRFGRERLGLRAGEGLITAAAAVATLPMLFLSTMLLSEPLFIALLLPVLLWAERTADPSPTLHDGPHTSAAALGPPIALGAVAGLLTLVRTHAVVLPVAIAIVLAHRRRWREAFTVLIAAASVMTPWLLWVAAHDGLFAGPLRGNYGSYVSWWREGIQQEGVGLLGATAQRNVQKMLGDSALYLQLGRGIAAHWLAIVALVVALLAGARSLATRAPVALSFLALYLALVVVWPFWPMRFLFGVWPLVTLLIAVGIHDAWQQREHSRVARWRRALTLGAGMVLVAGMCWSGVQCYRQEWWSALARANARPLAAELKWIARRTRAGDVIGTVNQPAVFLYTGRTAVPIVAFTAGEYVTPRAPDESVASMRSLVVAYRPSIVVATTPETWTAAATLARAATLVAVDTLHRVGVAYRPNAVVTARRDDARPR